MKRRTFLTASAATLAAPGVSRGADNKVLTFAPQADLAVLDPLWTTTYQTRDLSFPRGQLLEAQLHLMAARNGLARGDAQPDGA